jgi:uncharacterized protein
MENLAHFRNKILPVLEPYGIKRVALFGSIVRGEETPESDIDILVEFEEPRKKPLGLFGWIELEEELERQLGRKIDLVSSKALKPRIRPTAEKEMVILYEKQEQPRVPRRHSGRHQTHRTSLE